MIRCVLAVLVLVSSASAFAETAVTSETSVGGSALSRMTAQYWGILDGPSLTNPGDIHQPKADGSQGDPMTFDGFLAARYKFTEERQAGLAVPFLFTPSTGNGLNPGATLKDPFLQAMDSKFLTRGTFNLWMDARVYGGVTQVSRDSGQVAGLRLTQMPTYDVPGTKLSVGLYTFERVNLFTNGQREFNGNPLLDAQFDVAPFFSYALTEKMQATFWSDLLQLDHARGTGAIDGWSNEPIDVQVGINYDFTPSISLNPYINMYPQHPTLDASSFQMIVSTKFF